METLLQKDPDINVVYTINEPTAAGAYNALKAAGKADKAVIVSVDGGAPASRTSPMASSERPLSSIRSLWLQGRRAAVEYAKTGKKPEKTPGSTSSTPASTL